jgi:hypothetical protein
MFTPYKATGLQKIVCDGVPDRGPAELLGVETAEAVICELGE